MSTPTPKVGDSCKAWDYETERWGTTQIDHFDDEGYIFVRYSSEEVIGLTCEWRAEHVSCLIALSPGAWQENGP